MNTTNTSEETIAAQPEKVLYTAKAHTTGGLPGRAVLPCTSDGRLDVEVFRSPEAPARAYNPEQLLAVGRSSCYTSALKIVATPG